MKYLQIKNDGELDIRLLSLMGGTTKNEDALKIGQFGTGLKYSIAWLLRNNIDLRVFSGEKETKITTKQEQVRGKTFDVIHIDGEKTGMTSLMGSDWQAWMIVRELWCNALDEANPQRSVVNEVKGEKGCTSFFIQLAGEIKDVVDKWQMYFLHDIDPIWENDKMAIYPPSEQFRLYKNGVLIKDVDHTDKKPIYSYDLKDADINELREFRGSYAYAVSKCVSKLPRKQAEHFLSHIKGSFEEDIDYDWYDCNFDSGWREALGQAKIIDYDSYNNLKERGKVSEDDNLVQVPKTLFKKLNLNFEGISAVRTKDNLSSFFEVHDENVMLQVNKGLAILETCGYFIDPELTFLVGVFGDKRTLARINTEDKEIMVSEKMATQPLFSVVAMLIEENEHYKTGHGDETREFQQHFIDLYTKTLLNCNDIEL